MTIATPDAVKAFCARAAAAPASRRYGAAVALAVGAVALRLPLTPIWGDQFPFIFVFPAALLAALAGGLGPGLIAVLLSAALTVWLILPLDTPQHQLGLAVFLLINGLIAATAAALRGALLTIERQAAALRTQAQAAADSERLLRLTSRRLNALLAAAPVGISFSEDPSCARITGNPALLAQLEARADDNVSASAPDASAHGRQIKFFRGGEEIGAADLPLQRAVRENAVVAPIEIEVELPGGRRLFLEGRGAPVRDEAGRILGGIAITVDITERKRSEERIQVLMGEINHRSKNLLSVVQSIARQTMKGTDPKSFIEVFEKRLAGLAASQDLLIGSDWAGVDMADLIRSQLSHYKDLLERRIALEGPACRILPAAAQALGMAVHELGTNAAKYGALSADGGSVLIAWRAGGEGATRRFGLIWRESGGPPAASPERRGFGHTVLVQMARHALDAEVTLAYPREGLVWEISAPAARIIEDGAG